MRRIYKITRSPLDKSNLNRATNHLKKRSKEFKNENTKVFLRKLEVKRNDDFNLWKATKYLKRPIKRKAPIKGADGSCRRSDLSKASEFRNHLEKTFNPFSLSSQSQIDNILHFLDVPCQMDLPIKHVTPSEVKTFINKLNSKKSPGYDGINANVLKMLPRKGIVFLTSMFNSVLRLNHFPAQWKYAKIILIPKPNKCENEVTSYRPISLLVLLAKIFEKILLKRLLPFIETQNIIPDHQFGFRLQHGTPEQCHRIIDVITDTLERKLYCSAVFLDVQQAFDRVWHLGLLHKI